MNNLQPSDIHSADLTKSALHAYQLKAIQFAKARKSCALFLDPGLGKTIVTLTMLADLIKIDDAGRILIVAPLRVAESVWRQEAAKWQHTRQLSFQMLTGTPEQRVKCLENKANIYIINYEKLVWLVEATDFNFDTVVFDEFSKMKSTRSKLFKRYKQVMHRVYRTIGLTGTPASNGLIDLYGQIYLLDSGKRLGATLSEYKDRYFVSDYMGYKWQLRKNSEKTIHKSIKDICLSLSSHDYLSMPRRISNVIEVDMPERAITQYEKLENDFLLEIGEDTVEVWNESALTGKLLQFSNGALYTNEKRDWVEVHQAKLDALEDLIIEANGQPVLVAYNYQSDKDRILDRFKNAVCIKEKGAIERFQNGEVQICVAHPASAGHGINLQSGGHIIIWFGLNWSLELYHQFNARLYRQGQEKPVLIHHIVSKGTIDETVLRVLWNKHRGQKALLDALKRDIKEKRR